MSTQGATASGNKVAPEWHQMPVVATDAKWCKRLIRENYKMKEAKPASIGERIKKLDPGQFITVESIKGGNGSLQARKLASGNVKLYWRYTHDGEKLRDEIGLWDSAAPPLSLDQTTTGYSFRAAAAVCRVRGKLHSDERLTGGWPGHKARLQAESNALKELAASASEQTLVRLLETYCDYLQQRGRRSHADARSIFRLHIKEAFAEVATAPAASLSSDQVADMLRKLRRADKGRTANKLRSYLHAAFQCAVQVRYDDDLPETFKPFLITTNPVSVIVRKSEADRPDKNPLSLPLLRRYWKSLEKLDGVKGAALRLLAPTEN